MREERGGGQHLFLNTYYIEKGDYSTVVLIVKPNEINVAHKEAPDVKSSNKKTNQGCMANTYIQTPENVKPIQAWDTTQLLLLLFDFVFTYPNLSSE